MARIRASPTLTNRPCFSHLSSCFFFLVRRRSLFIIDKHISTNKASVRRWIQEAHKQCQPTTKSCLRSLFINIQRNHKRHRETEREGKEAATAAVVAKEAACDLCVCVWMRALAYNIPSIELNELMKSQQQHQQLER